MYLAKPQKHICTSYVGQQVDGNREDKVEEEEQWERLMM